MRYGITSPWDGLWVAVFMSMIVIDTAHILSPMILSWTDGQLRREAASRRREFVILPALAAGVATLIGVLTSLGYTDYVPGLHKMFYIGYQWRMAEPLPLRLLHAAWDCIKIPMPLLMLSYVLWQIWHFGSQNFGLACIYMRKSGRAIRYRQLLRAACVTGTGIFMLPMPLALFRVPQGYVPGHEMLFLSPWLAIPLLVLVSGSHWLTALWLSARVSQLRYWLPLLLVVGMVGLLWQKATPYGPVVHNLPWLVSLGIGLSFVHYIYDATIWKRGSPAMQAVLA